MKLAKQIEKKIELRKIIVLIQDSRQHQQLCLFNALVSNVNYIVTPVIIYLKTCHISEEKLELMGKMNCTFESSDPKLV